MIEVELPDGTIAEFPDGTAPDVMKRALQKRFGAPQQPQSPEMTQGLVEMSAMTQNPSKARYDAMPTWQKPIVAASDMLQLGANGVTFGFGDKAVASARSMFTDKSYDEELAAARGLTQGARNRAGNAGTVAEISGAIATPVGLAGRGITLAGRGGTAAMTGAKGLAARSGLMAAEGAGYGAATAAGNDQDIGTGATIGAVGGAAGNVIGEGVAAGVGKVAGLFNKKPMTPSVESLKAAGSAAFKRAEAEGVMFNQNGVNQLRTNIIDDLTAKGFDPANEPGVMPVIKRLESIGQGNITFEGLKTLRTVASNGFRPGMNSNNARIGEIIDRIDELVDANDPATILMGRNPAAASQAVKDARKYWHMGKKLETVEKHIRKGGQMANSNVLADEVGATKKQLRSILTSDAKSRGFNPAEMKQLEKSAGYTGGQRVLHAVSGLMPRDKLSTAVHVAAGGPSAIATGGASLPLQAGLMGVGYTAQKTNEWLARKSVAELTRLIGNGGIAPAQVQNLMQRLAKSKRDALSRALMAISVHQGNARGNAPGHEQQPR